MASEAGIPAQATRVGRSGDHDKAGQKLRPSKSDSSVGSGSYSDNSTPSTRQKKKVLLAQLSVEERTKEHLVFDTPDNSGSDKEEKEGDKGESSDEGDEEEERRQPGFTGTWSSGSELHELGLCRPCAWNVRPSGCFKGEGCVFCHTCVRAEVLSKRRARVKEKKQLKSRGRWLYWDKDDVKLGDGKPRNEASSMTWEAAQDQSSFLDVESCARREDNAGMTKLLHKLRAHAREDDRREEMNDPTNRPSGDRQAQRAVPNGGYRAELAEPKLKNHNKIGAPGLQQASR